MNDRTPLWRLRALSRVALEAVYEAKLMSESAEWRLPRHLGIVMDGNRRFARGHGADDVVSGHVAGAEKLEEVLDWCAEIGIDYVTAWIFSLDNFTRDEHEVGGLMRLFERKFRELVVSPKIHRNGIRICPIGRLDVLPPAVQTAIRAAEAATRHHERRILNVGVAYGGREEIIDALKAHLREAGARGQTPEQIADALEADDVSRHLYTAHVPDPDLILRTSGEVRLSGFLMWQSAHSELYFSDTLWPALRKIDFLRAIRSFSRRQRRYGR